MLSYDYSRRQGVLEISWQDFGELVRRLVEKLAPYQPQAIVGNARAGLFPATAAACMLRCELYPARLTRRLNDEVITSEPRWITPVSPEVAGKVVAVVDEIADFGRHPAPVGAGCAPAWSATGDPACLVSHTWASPAPEVTGLVTDELVLFPWDRQIFQAGAWQEHPELAEALKLQEQQNILETGRRQAPSDETLVSPQAGA